MEQRRLAAQKLRQMWQGNLVIMISVIFMVRYGGDHADERHDEPPCHVCGRRAGDLHCS